MDIFVHAASWFFNLFQTGGQIFISWTTVSVDSDGKVTGFGFRETVLMLLVAMNSLIQLIGQDRMNGLAIEGRRQPVQPFPLLLPFVARSSSPMALSLGRFLPEKYKPKAITPAPPSSATPATACSRINAGELFIWLGIAGGVISLGLDPIQLALRATLAGRHRDRLPRQLGHRLHHPLGRQATGRHPPVPSCTWRPDLEAKISIRYRPARSGWATAAHSPSPRPAPAPARSFTSSVAA